MMKIILKSLFFVVCYFVAFEGAIAKSSISGKLLKSTGKPLAYTEIELIPIDSDKIVSDSRYVAISNTLGQFAFSDVPNGTFDLSINSDDKPSELSPYGAFFFPNTTERKDARFFEIKDNTKISGLVFQLPPQLIKKTIIGKLIWKNATQLRNAMVLLRDVKSEKDLYYYGQVKVDSKGVFSLSAFEGRRYQLLALIMSGDPPFGIPIAKAKTAEFVAVKSTPIFELIFEEVKDTERPLGNDIGKQLKYFAYEGFEIG
jgi:hypothetical protein